MRFAFNEEQAALKESARRFLETHWSARRAHALEGGARPPCPELLLRMAREMGWLGLTIPAEYGGSGCSAVWMAALMEEMGRALLAGPFFATVCMAAEALQVAGSHAQKREHLPRIVAGETQAALAFSERQGRCDPAEIEAVARPVQGGYVLSGIKRYVLDGHTAGLLVVAARAPDTRGEEGISLFLVPGDSPGLDRTQRPTLDFTRPLADVVLREVRVRTAALLGEPGLGWRPLERALTLATTALTAEQVGGAEQCLEMAVQYAKTRVQFGRPIGSFQAIKHKCADMLLVVESARSASYHAAWCAAETPSALTSATRVAKAYCSEAYVRCASENIQVHGGVGFTWEHDAHLYFKRAHGSARLFGSAAEHRERIAASLEL